MKQPLKPETVEFLKNTPLNIQNAIAKDLREIDLDKMPAKADKSTLNEWYDYLPNLAAAIKKKK